jgi:hypothetical protein
MLQAMLYWYSSDQRQSITHLHQSIHTSGISSTDDTAIEFDRSDLQTCRVSKQRHYLATSWCKDFGLERRHVAASVASSIPLVSTVPDSRSGL